MNEDRTCTGADTTLTQPRTGFVLEDTRRQLIAIRNKHRADSPIGHRCSNLCEMMESRRPEGLL